MAGEAIELIQEVLGQEHSLASEIANLWTRWDQDRSVWKRNIKSLTEYLYAISTRSTDNGRNFEHSTHRPKLAQLYDTLVANYFSGLMPTKAWLSIVSEDQGQYNNKDQRNKILAYIRTKHRLSKFASVLEDLVDDWVLYGNAFAMVYYTSESTNEDNAWGQYENNYKGPRVRRISPYDIVFNPRASSFERSPKIIRSLSSLGELVRDAQDNPDDGWKMDVVDSMREQRVSLMTHQAEDINKSTQLVIDGFGSFAEYIQSDVVEILELYGDVYDKTTGELHRDQVITVADRRYVIRQQALSNWTGRPRIHHAGWRKRKDNLWAMGPLENVVGMQYRIDHLENARADAFDEMLYGDLVVTGAVEVEQHEDGSKTYTVAEGGSVGRLAPDTSVLNADFQISQLEQMMELYVGAPREAAGFRTPGEKTKFEVSVLTSAASRLFQHKMTRFEVEMLEEIVNSEIMVAAQSMGTGAEKVRYDNPDESVADFLEVTKEDLLIKGRVVPIGARHYARKQQLAGDFNSFTQVLATDQELRAHFPSVKLAQFWESVLDAEEFNLFEAYGRLDEQVEVQRRTQAAQQQLANESAAQDGLGEGGVI
jgi:hypothetical protein